jgi:hypothetical protein
VSSSTILPGTLGEVSNPNYIYTSWTAANSYTDVDISVPFSSSVLAEQTGIAYLVNQIGAGTTTANEIARSTFIIGLNTSPSNFTLFSN